MAKKNISDLKDNEIKSKRILVRVDFNVPLDEKGAITNDKRIVTSLPTIKYLIEKGGRIILMSHLGRPKGQIKEELRLTAVGKRLGELLGKTVRKLDDCIGEEVEKTVSQMKDGDVILLENVRFYKEEEENDEVFAKKLASLGDIYVSDAFGTVHRAHASTAGIAQFLPAVAGFLIQKEIEFLGNALTNPKRPFVAIIGGAKISTKIAVIENLLTKVDVLIVGGGMAYTFFKARGIPIGKSICEEDKIEEAKLILKKAIDRGVPFLLPLDHIIVEELKPGAKSEAVPRMGIKDGWSAVDIGPESIKKFGLALKEAKTIVWNGPLGVFEYDEFAKGTIEIAKKVAESDAVSIVGGGDSISAIKKAGVSDRITHISTGGGASLEFLEGKELPGIACLQDK